MAIMLVGAAPSWAATSSPTFDNVQIFVHTTNSTFTGTYTVTAYNSTGDAVITYQTPYPAASFELPSASYIFSVSADSQYQGYCILKTPLTTATGESSPPVSTASSGSSSGGTAIIMPPCYSGYTESEYGFVAQQVSGPTSITISTVPMQNFPTTTISVHVTYANGTAASGASVYANVLGGDWYSLNSATVLNTSGQVGADGTAKLVVPAAPVQVTAWNWVPVNLPKNPGTTVVTVGGQKVNVSVTWEPAYVGFAGSVLIVPPQTSGSIVLQLQQPQFWATPEGVLNQGSLSAATPAGAAVSGTAATVSNSPNLVPASLTSAQSTAAASTQTIVQTSTVTEPASSSPIPTTTTTSAATNYDTILFTVVGALALGIASASLIIVRRRPDA